MTDAVTVLQGDCLTLLPTLAAGSVACVVTSPPYNLGASPSAQEHPHSSRGAKIPDWQYEGDRDDLPEPEYRYRQAQALTELHRVAAPRAAMFYVHKDRLWDGRMISPLLWLSFSEWVLRQQIPWDRGGSHNKQGSYFDPRHEYVFWLTHGTGSLQLGALARWGSVWHIGVKSKEAPWHPCPFPLELARRCILAGSQPGDVVIDPYGGAFTVPLAAAALGRRAIVIERQPHYVALGRERLAAELPALTARWAQETHADE